MNTLRIFIFLILLPIAAFARQQSPLGNYDKQILDAIEVIYLSDFGLNFPRYEEDAARAIALNVKERVRAFEEVMSAKEFLQKQIQRDPDRVLKITLDAIFWLDSKHVSSSEEYARTGIYPHIEYRGVGAIIALYLFKTEEQDQIIFECAKMASPTILNYLFRTDFAWQYNRPDPQRWITFVETIPQAVFFPNDSKDRIISTFKEKKYRKFGIMLDRPHKK